MSNQFQTVMLDGRRVLVPVDLPEGPKNPPLAALNASYRQADAERRDEAEESIEAVADTLRNKLCGERVLNRRTQKPLRPVSQKA